MNYLIKIGFLVDIYLVFCLIVFKNLSYYNFFNQKPLILELLKIGWEPNLGFGLFFSVANIILLYFFIKKIFSSKVAFISVLVYSLSCWSVYFGVFNLSAILAVFFLLLLGLGVVLSSKQSFGLAGIGLIGLLSLTLLFWPPILLGIVILLFWQRKKIVKKFWLAFFVTLLWILVLIVIGTKDPVNLKHQFNLEVTLFQDVGLINTVNRFQGQLRESQWANLGRIIDNKYSYLSLKFLYNTVVQFTLFPFFTSGIKLLGFSAEPPILVGFLIPFVAGLKEIIIQKKFWILGSLFLFLIPSILSDQSPNLNRLFIIFPIFCLIIGLGFSKLQTQNKKIFLLTIFLIVFQLTVVLADVYLREIGRLTPLVEHIYGKL